jgi:hypothetical protein
LDDGMVNSQNMTFRHTPTGALQANVHQCGTGSCITIMCMANDIHTSLQKLLHTDLLITLKYTCYKYIKDVAYLLAKGTANSSAPKML